jgi:hypothetical protein
MSLTDRLKLRHYDARTCSAAIHGEEIPHALGFPVTRYCVLRGIRYHAGFATELRGLQNYPEFTRALNARSIMSNIVPDMASLEHIPYCIWHPDVATEETYRELVRRYPQMRYQVGRACAVAGYLDLYRELQLLPDVSIAEEARDNIGRDNGGSQAIFNEIVAQHVKYAVMDDYTRSVNINGPRPGAVLNGDTAVRSLLEVKRKYARPLTDPAYGEEFDWDGFDDEYQFEPDDEHYFNITEDWNMDVYAFYS